VRAAVAAGAAVALLGACSAGSPADPAPTALSSPTAAGSPEPLPVRAFEGLSHDHVQGVVAYEQTPPVGGPHNARWLACGVYDQQVPPAAAVHSMEHGGVWITHAPDLPADDVARLAELAELDGEYVLVSPFDGLPSPVVASTWGLQLVVDEADDDRLATFVRAYAGGDQGGEPGAPCRTGGLSPAQAEELVAGAG
jgi:hypothetical protein